MGATGLEPVTSATEVESCQDVTATTRDTLAQSLARKTQTDANLAALLSLWDQLPESGRNLLRHTAETLVVTLSQESRKAGTKP